MMGFGGLDALCFWRLAPWFCGSHRFGPLFLDAEMSVMVLLQYVLLLEPLQDRPGPSRLRFVAFSAAGALCDFHWRNEFSWKFLQILQYQLLIMTHNSPHNFR